MNRIKEKSARGWLFLFNNGLFDVRKIKNLIGYRKD